MIGGSTMEAIGFLAARTSFPPASPGPGISVWGVLLHVLLLALAVMAVLSLYLTSKRQVRPIDFYIWPALATTTIALVYLGIHPDIASAILGGTFLFVLLVSLVGFILTLVRWLRRSERWSNVWITCLCCAALVLVVGMFLPATPSAREAARRSDCKNRMRQIAIAMHYWHDDHGRLPDLQIGDDGEPPRSWRVELLPYLDEERLRQEYDDRKRWNDPGNDSISKTSVPDLQCPSVGCQQNVHDESGRYFTHYFALTGPDTVFPGGRGLSLEEISNADGTSKTIMLTEASGMNVVWTEPRDVDAGKQPVGINIPGATPYDSAGILSTYHYAGVNVSMADASVFTVPKNIDPKILKALTTVHGNDPVDRGF